METIANLKSFFTEKVHTDSFVFRLHYRLTVVVFLALSSLTTITAFFGKPIKCIQNDKPATEFIETYCWGHSTFSVLSTKYTGGNEERISNESRFFHTYYQWVPIVLFLQAICFYFPHFLWKNSDSCLISEYAKNIKGHLVPIEKIRYVSDHFLETLHQHPRLWLFYLLLEFANLGNLLFQFMFLSSFLDVDFLTLGYDMLKYYLGYSQHNPMKLLFPLLTKCSFDLIGPSGTTTLNDVLCVLSMNVIHEKVYAFLGIYLFSLLLITIVHIGIFIYKLFVVANFPGLHQYVLCWQGWSPEQAQSAIRLYHLLSPNSNFILITMAQNLSQTTYVTLLTMIYEDLSGQLDCRHSQNSSSSSSGDVEKKQSNSTDIA